MGKKTRTLFFYQQGSNRRYKIFKSCKQIQNSFYSEWTKYVLHPTEYILQLLSFKAQLKSHFFQPTFHILWGQGSYLNKLCILFRQRKQLWLGTKEIWKDGKEGSNREEKRGRQEEGRTKEWKHVQDPVLLELQSLWTPAEYFWAMSGY